MKRTGFIGVFVITVLLLNHCSKGLQSAYEDLHSPVLSQPLVTTKTPESITSLSALSGGEAAASTNTAYIKAKGVCWSVSPNPKTTDFCTVNNSGAGVFTSEISGLSPNTTYYVRAYASYEGGTAYGDEKSFKTDLSFNDLTGFQFLKSKNPGLSSDKTGIIMGNTVSIYIESNADLSSLVADFVHTGVSVKVGALNQVSGVTPNSFVTDTVYRVIGSSGVYKDFTVKVVPMYQVVYHSNGANGGSVPIDVNYYPSSYEVPVLANQGALERTGYSFAGWNTKSDGSGTNYNPGVTLIMPSSGVTLYARWTTAATYKLEYDGNGNDSGSVPESHTGLLGGTSIKIKEKSDVFKKTGYSFQGWNTQADGYGTLYQAGIIIKVNSDKKLYARWVKKITVTYNKMGTDAEVTESIPSSQDYFLGETVTVTSNLLTKPGYNFKGWNTQQDGSGVSYSAYSTFKIVNYSDITLYAKWAPTYSVVYHANGANDGTEGNIPVYGNTYEQRVSATILGSVGPLRKINVGGISQYFDGWNTQANGLGATYYQDSSISLGTGNITLYAKWKEYAVGDTGPGGGKVFYVNPIGYINEQRYFEVENNPNVTSIWSNVLSPRVENTYFELGKGYNNTLLIIAQNTHSNSAAKICNDKTTNGKNDWFLPSLNELIELNIKKDFLNNIDGFVDLLNDDYWSSSEDVFLNSSMMRKFSSDTSDQGDKAEQLYVRCIRAF